MALPEPERAKEFERACAEHPALRESRPEILATLAASTGPTPSHPVGPISPASMVLALQSGLEVAPTESPGTRVGPFQLLQKIGEGGFSTVWLAEQSAPIRRNVAVKVIKLGMDTEEVISRFEAERQALALMDHPNIARVFDAGATESGRPYFVMELVRGVPITRYCDENRLTAEARLRLFIAVCQAVEHAHQKGVIHRDIKPSNILVTLYDGVPVPKIIDFGIAKATGARLTEKTLVTQFHAFIGTPAYSSPEQMEMSALDVDTRSDIYSLGVMLYELLCGCLPFDADTLSRSGLEAMRRMICEVEPPRPSARLGTLPHEKRTTMAQQRGTQAATLSLLLRGDLDWIVMRCLEKDRRRRYGTATALATDIEHHLADEPVRARPPSRIYLLQKHVRRHRLAYGSGGVLVAVLVLGIAVSSWQAIRATRAEHEQARLRAVESHLRESAEAQALSMRRRAYASDMNLLQQALAVDNFGRARELLNRQRPQPGERDLRGWEWRYLWQFCRSDSTAVLNDQPLLAREVSLSADGNWLATVRQDDSTIELWNLRTREHSLVPVPPGIAAAAVAFSPTESLLAIATATLGDTPVAQLILWDPGTRQTVRRWPLPLGPYEELGYLIFSADGARLLTMNGRTPVVWSVADGRRLQTLSNPSQDHLAMTADFSLAAIVGTNGHDGSVQLLDTTTGTERTVIRATTEYIIALAFSPDGRILATAGSSPDTNVCLWDVTTGSSLGALEGAHDSPQTLVFWPDGKTLAAGAYDQTIRVWDVSSRRLVRTLHGHEHGLFDLALLPDEKTLVSSARDGTIRLWSTETAETPGGYSRLAAPVMHWRVSQDSQSVVTLDAMGGVCRWHGRGFVERDELLNIGPPGGGAPWHACMAADRPLIAIIKPNDVVQIWNWETKLKEHEIHASTADEALVAIVAFVEDGRRLLLNWASEDTKRHGLSEWDLATGTPTQSWAYSGPDSFPSGWFIPQSAVSADGKWCLVGWSGNPWSSRPDDRGPVSLINLVTGVQRELPGAVFWRWGSASFSADGRLFAMPSPYVELPTTVWDLQTVRVARTLENAFSAAFSPDGERLVDGNGKLRDTANWEELLKLKRNSSFILEAGFSPDGNLFAAHSQFGTLHLWRAPSWTEIEAAERAGMQASFR